MNPFSNPFAPLDGFSGYGVPGDPMEDVLSLQSLSAEGEIAIESPSNQCSGSNSCSGSNTCTDSNVCTGSNSCANSNICG